ncbi:hypothetical protein KAR26_00965 [Candidatus Parcubacteria bacterium]|nr:hypothetical protein [Candidatus Parcubacteria bacterium]
MLSRIIEIVKKHHEEVILLIGVVLISLLSFSIGYIVAFEEAKEPIRVEYDQELE